MRLAILGGGRAAWAFGSAWRRVGWPIAGVWLRDESRSSIVDLLGTVRGTVAEITRDADLALVAVSDRAIAEVAALVPVGGPTVFHASGALTSIRGGFSLHPLKSLPPVGIESDLRDTLLVFEGAHRPVAQTIAAALGARFAEVAAENKVLYHAAAVFGSNYVAAMLDLSERLMASAGVTGIRQDLIALAHSAIANWSGHTDPRRFTGPAARGDRAVMNQHLGMLQQWPQLAEIYKLVAAEIARESNASTTGPSLATEE
jgi:predicted short-subunit dehydrogenase-like oxidoreductase (DUF2520 family)